jgi:hypothetical protein
MKLKIAPKYTRTGTLLYYIYKRYWGFFWEEVGFPQPDMEQASYAAIAILERERDRRKQKPKREVRFYELFDDGQVVRSEK